MTGRHRFTCGTCGADVVIDDEVRESILHDGCPICLAEVTEEAFEAVACTEP